MLDCPADALERLRRRKPRVHCIVNAVAANLTANVVLALDGTPSMTSNVEEVRAFVATADALLVNLGMLGTGQPEAVMRAIDCARSRRIPWVLDPVMVERSPRRLALANSLMAFEPDAIRGNETELAVLAGSEEAGGLSSLATRGRWVVIQTGAHDRLVSRERYSKVANGHALMTRVTGTGCASGAVIAACLASVPARHAACELGVGLMGVSAELAAERACGPGSFAVHLMDRLANLDGDSFAERLRLGETQL